MSKFIYDEVIADLSDKVQRDAFKQIKPRLRQKQRVLVTRRYAPQAYTYQKQHNIVGRVINMYDYFQDAIDVQVHDLHIRKTPLIDHKQLKIVGVSPNESDLYHEGTQVAKVDIAPLTVPLIGTITWLNPMGEPASRDFYDRRGFLSSTQYFHRNGNMGHQIMFSPDGTPKMEIICMARDGKEQVTGYKLLNYQGADYLFANEQEVWNFFKAELESGVVR